MNEEWQCKCEDDWSGTSCNIPLEKICDDRIDNDNGEYTLFYLMEVMGYYNSDDFCVEKLQHLYMTSSGLLVLS